MSSPKEDMDEVSSSPNCAINDTKVSDKCKDNEPVVTSSTPEDIRPPAKRPAPAVIEISDSESNDSDICAVTSYLASADEVKKIRGDYSSSSSSSTSSSEYSSDSDQSVDDDSVVVENQTKVHCINSCLNPRANRMDVPLFNSQINSQETKEKLALNWKLKKDIKLDDVTLTNDPFPLFLLHNVLSNPEIINNIVDDMNTLDWTRKKLDLFEFHQTADLASLTWQRSIRGIYEMLKTDMMSWVSSVTGLPLESVSCACSLYGPGDRLLVHDDLREDRRVAFILYLSPWNSYSDRTAPLDNGDTVVVDECESGWSENMGGALELFSTDDEGRALKAVKSVLPHNNMIALFQVSNISFHQVSEVVSLEVPRLSINGWYHGPSDTKTDNIADTVTVKPADPVTETAVDSITNDSASTITEITSDVPESAPESDTVASTNCEADTDMSNNLTDASKNVTDTSNNVTDASKNVTDASKNVTDASNNVTDASNNVTDASKNVTDASKNVTDASKNVTDASNNVTDASNNVTDASNNVTDASNNVTDASNNVTDTSNNVTDTNKVLPDTSIQNLTEPDTMEVMNDVRTKMNLQKPHSNVVLITEWVSSTYMTPKSRLQISKQMEEHSEVALYNFFTEDKYTQLLDALNHQDTVWIESGPAHLRHCDVLCPDWLSACDPSHVVRTALDLVSALPFHRLLTDCTDLNLTHHSTPTIRRWTLASYELLPHPWRYNWSRLETVVYLGVGPRRPCGGDTVFTVPEDSDSDALVTLPPKDNALNLVFCDVGAASFTKYVSKLSLPFNVNNKYFYTLSCVYSALNDCVIVTE